MTEEQLDLIGRETERAANKALRRYTKRSAAAYLVALVLLVFLSFGYLSELKSGLVGSCDRVNVLRAQSNASDIVSFNILSSAAMRERQLANTDDPSNKKAHLQSAEALAREAGTLTVTDLTHCDKAVDDPENYVTPVAGPIGDPASGVLNPGIQDVINESQALLKSERAKG